VTGAEGSDWKIASESLGCTITAHHNEPLPIGSEVTVMVRPEKMSIGRQPVAGAINNVSGRITDIAYLGDMSIYHVKLPGGAKLQVSQANMRHGGGGRLEHDEEVSISWHPGDSVVLLA
jgi:putrescine transport system ATP-binding protein